MRPVALRLSAIGAALACAVGAVYLAGHREQAAAVRDADDRGVVGDLDGALREAARVTRAPAAARARQVEAYALLGLGRMREADAAFARAVRLSPNDWVLRRDWAVVRARLGDRRGAQRQLRRARRLNPLLPRDGGIPGGLPRGAD